MCLPQFGSILWHTAGCLVLHVERERERAVDLVPSVTLRSSTNPSHLYVSSHAHRSAEAAECCPYHLSRCRQASRTHNKTVNGLHFSKYKQSWQKWNVWLRATSPASRNYTVGKWMNQFLKVILSLYTYEGVSVHSEPFSLQAHWLVTAGRVQV